MASAADTAEQARGAAGTTASVSGFIGGRFFDGAFFFGAAGLCAAVGALLVALPVLVIPAWWLFATLVDGPHLCATWARTYLDADERHRRGRLLLASLLLLPVGFVFLGAARATGSRAPWDLFLLVAALWSFHHNVRQHYGILAVYERLDGAGANARRVDGGVLQVGLWLMFGLSAFGHPWNRKMLSLPPDPSPFGRALLLGGVTLLGALLGLYVVVVVLRARRRSHSPLRRPLRPALFVLFPIVALNLFTFFVVGAFEPLVPRPRDPEHYFLGATVVGGTFHGVQYLGMIFATNRRRYRDRAPGSLAARLGRSPLLAYGAFVLVSLALYGVLNAARGGPRLALFPYDSDAARAFLALYWGLFFHHYYLDQRIWHPSRDPHLRVELGLAAPTAT